MVQELTNTRQRDLNIFIAGTCRSKGHGTNNGSEFVIDSVIQLAQKDVFERRSLLRSKFCHWDVTQGVLREVVQLVLHSLPNSALELIVLEKT